mmetsp:Transcript_31747/g.88956  ORF Transcript_31747/g.88956 Transcript_31747/m.88956 type:complete len:144 (+) Transcript_31747:181-612(+)|eukprot:CAMPEP_0119131574 /NCGR_PEP_ID=MMETSP1310-20130426/10460_1 /TAXON_ID=464262 /ORGANISM="Genus nov. species nov., Strain RCC2339" /LENGTH=143 /DNA_ID=CAMNT_0007122157 /DNA_START=129 /DNA_END=560 /DNA_ORIENTATION=+
MAETNFKGFVLGMAMSDAEARANALYAGVFQSVRAVKTADAPLDILFERPAQGRPDMPLVTLCGKGENRETATLRKVVFDPDTLDSCFGCRGFNDAQIAEEMTKLGAPSMQRTRQKFGRDKILGTNDEGWKFEVDKRVFTISM